MSSPENESKESSPSLGSTLARSAKIVAVLLALLLGGIAVAAFVMGGESDLPFEYEGFD